MVTQALDQLGRFPYRREPKRQGWRFAIVMWAMSEHSNLQSKFSPNRSKVKCQLGLDESKRHWISRETQFLLRMMQTSLGSDLRFSSRRRWISRFLMILSERMIGSRRNKEKTTEREALKYELGVIIDNRTANLQGTVRGHHYLRALPSLWRRKLKPCL